MSDQIEVKLKDFLTRNSDLERLSDILGQFNMFDVLKVSSQEIRHSNTLAWLLDPKESHGLQDKFLSRFLSLILSSEDLKDNQLDVLNSIRTFLPVLSPELETFDNVSIYREYKNIDLLIKIERFSDKKVDFAILIENKINSRQSKGQLKKYLETVKKEFENVIPVFLTLSPEEPEVPFLVANYELIYNILKEFLSLHRSQIPDEQFLFLNHYLKTLGRLTMNEEEIRELCRKIYGKHKLAIDEIMRYASNNRNRANEIFLEMLDEIKFPKDSTARAWGAVFFIPEFLNLKENYGVNKWDDYYKWNNLFSCDFYLAEKKQKYELKLVVGNIEDKDLARIIVDAINESGVMKGKTLDLEKVYGQKTTRLLRESIKCATDDSGEILVENSSSELKKFYDSFIKKIEPLGNALKKLK